MAGVWGKKSDIKFRKCSYKNDLLAFLWRKSGKIRLILIVRKFGRLAQLVRASGLHPVGRGFESLNDHNC